MYRFAAAAAAMMTFGTGQVAQADHWMQTADPQVVMALNQMIETYSYFCSSGNQIGCQLMQQTNQAGAMMLNAGYDCQMNRDQQACNFYQQSLMQLQQAYMGLNNALGAQQFNQIASANPLGATHAERMEAISNWGQERLEWGRQQADISSANTQAFIDAITQ